MTERPKILMVGPWPPTKGGITTFMRNVVGSPLKQQYRFIPFTTSRPGKRNVKGDNYGYLAMFRGGAKRAIMGILITLWHLAIYPFVVVARWPAVIQIHASDFQAFWEAALYVLMAKILGRPVVLRIGGSFNHFWDSSGARARAAIRWTLRQPAVLVVQSEYWKDYMLSLDLGRAGPVVIVNNFVPDRMVEKRTQEPPAVARFLLYAGENPRLKGAYVVFEAVRLLAARGIKAEVTLMAVTAPLREEIIAKGHDAYVNMLDFLSHDEVLATLRRTDVFLQISTSEGFPNNLLEAMALGCTAIVTAVGAVPEVVGPGEATAFTVPIGDAPALAEAMARLAADPGLLARMAAAAQARLAEKFTERSVAKVLDGAYRLAMGR